MPQLDGTSPSTRVAVTLDRLGFIESGILSDTVMLFEPTLVLPL